MFEMKNSYPVILIPGLVAYGEETKTHKLFPYFGMSSTSWQKIINDDMGIPCHTVSFELFSGIWDRACELYAQLVGGTVDYGVAHSEKYGHPRFGKTYDKPMLTEWKRITLIAHGFGAPVARLFAELLYEGSAEERAATPKGELSGLFRGGNREKIHAIVTIGGINEGISLFEAFEGRLHGAKKAMVKGGTLAEIAMLYKDYIDPYYSHRGISVSQHRLSARLLKKDGKTGIQFNEKAIGRYLENKDNVFYDMSPEGMKRLNSQVGLFEDIYYLSYTGSVTKNFFNFITVPNLKAGVTLPTAALISTFENYLPEAQIITKENAENDGWVNTNSSMAPSTEAATAFRDVSRCRPGIWYQMPVLDRNHFSFIGLFIRPDKHLDEVYDLMHILCNLE